MNFRTFTYRFIFTAGTLLTILSCANRGMGPQGGPIDEDPPHFLRSTPSPNQTHFNKKKLVIEFDEIVQLEKQQEKVIVSPPQINPPEIRTSGRKIHIELLDSLIPNTTYVVDFSDAVVDNNEKNALENFVLAFSTGATIDSLQVGGKLLNAEDLEPITGMYVGLHSNMNDSAFLKNPFDRIAVSDALGKFTLKNVSEGSYRLFAIKDIDRSMTFNMPNEDIAFSFDTIIPSVKMVMHKDTIWKDTLTVDTIIDHRVNEYSPMQLILRAFNEREKIAYLEKYERPEQKKLTFLFAAPNKELPTLKPLNFESKEWFALEQNATRDTLTYWLTDSLVYKKDTLEIQAEYLRTDSLKQLNLYTDTLKFTFTPPAPPKEVKQSKRKKKEAPEAPKMQYLEIRHNLSSQLDIPTLPLFTAQVPMVQFDPKAIRLVQVIDTAHQKEIPINIQRDSLNPRNFSFVHKWEPKKEYILRIDSATIVGINGLHNNKIEQKFTIKSLEEYGGIFINIHGLEGDLVAVLLNSQDKPVRSVPVVDGTAEFFYVKPDKYYLRLFVDSNKNGIWDTGNYRERRQPESVYYYPEMFELRANWDIEQDWTPTDRPIDQQKPLEITKNKPKEKEPKVRY